MDSKDVRVDERGKQVFPGGVKRLRIWCWDQGNECVDRLICWHEAPQQGDKPMNAAARQQGEYPAKVANFTGGSGWESAYIMPPDGGGGMACGGGG
jgi:hypothetical protein